MAWCDAHWFSDVLQKCVACNVLLPWEGEPPFSVFYLLHGLSDDHTIWLRRTRIEEYLPKGLMIVMPDGFRGAYTKNEKGPDYDKYIHEELHGFIERNFRARTDRAGRCIGGLSMGGYGAVRGALAHPDKYISANSHSGALQWGLRTPEEYLGEEFVRVFGTAPAGSGHDSRALARRIAAADRPALRIDCGTEDFLIEHNRQFHRDFEAMGYEHEYEEFPGDHNWGYWDLHVREALAFHQRHLKPA